jgi:hypothetical protein
VLVQEVYSLEADPAGVEASVQTPVHFGTVGARSGNAAVHFGTVEAHS